MKTITHVFITFLFIGFTLKANTPPKNTLIVKAITYKLNLHWQNTGKEILIVAAPVAMAEDDVVPKKGSSYLANTKFGTGTAISNGFVVYMGKENAITISELEVGHTYYCSSFEADANGDFTIPGPALTSFVVMSLGHNAHLVWKSSGEITNDKVIVERSTDSKNWMQIENAGALPLIRELPGINFYDKGPLDGKYSYRIKHTYSNKETIITEPVDISSFSMTAVFSVSPPEVNESIYFIMADSPTELTITNGNGEVVNKITLEEKTGYSYFLKDVPPGIYNIRGTNNKGVLNEKVTIK